MTTPTSTSRNTRTEPTAFGAEDFTTGEGLRALLNRLAEGGEDAWVHDPVARDLMEFAADKYRALARKHKLDTWEAVTAAFDAMQAAHSRNADVLIIDTAGRLHTKDNLMQELAKIRRVVQKTVPEGDLSRVAYSMAKNMRFEPTVSNAGRNRAFSWLIFPFNAPQDPAARSALMQPCHLEKVAWADR